MKINKKTHDWIISRLVAHTPKDDIVLRLVEELQIPWPQAEAIVAQVQHESALKIEQGRAPLLAAVTLAIFLGGVGLALYGVYPFWQVFVVQKTPASLVNLSLITMRYGPYAFYALPTGIAMIVGSLMGLNKIWGTLLDTLFAER